MSSVLSREARTSATVVPPAPIAPASRLALPATRAISRRMLVALLLLAPIFWLCLFRNLGGSSLHTADEAAHTRVAENMLLRHSFLEPWYFDRPYVGKPPLKIWITALLLKVLGKREWVVRLPDAMAATLLVLLVLVLAKRFGGIEAGFAAAMILVTAPYPLAVHGFRQGVQDTALCLLLTLSVWFLLEAGILEGRPATAPLVLAALALGAASLVKSVAAWEAFLPPLAALLLARRWRDLFNLRFVLFALLALLPWVAWYRGSIPLELTWNLAKRVTGWHSATHPASTYLTWLFEGMAPWSWLLVPAFGFSIFRAVREKSRFDRFLLLWSLSFLLPWTVASLKHPWYIYPAYPPLAIMVGRLLAWRSGERSPASRARFAVFLLFAAMAIRQAYVITRAGDRVVLHRLVLSEKRRSSPRLAVLSDPRKICPDERWYLRRLHKAPVYLAATGDLVSLALAEQGFLAVLPFRDLPRLLHELATAGVPLESVRTARFRARCRRAPGLGPLPERALVSWKRELDDEGLLSPLPLTLPWQGFYRQERDKGGSFAWTDGHAALWLPAAGCHRIRLQLLSFGHERRLHLGGVADQMALVSATTWSSLDLPLLVPGGGGFLTIDSKEPCLTPSQNGGNPTDTRCLAVAVRNIAVDPTD